jgi:hypothetical protein
VALGEGGGKSGEGGGLKSSVPPFRTQSQLMQLRPRSREQGPACKSIVGYLMICGLISSYQMIFLSMAVLHSLGQIKTAGNAGEEPPRHRSKLNPFMALPPLLDHFLY